MMTNLKHFLSALVGLTPAGIYDVTVYQLGSWLFAGEVVMEASEEKWKFMRVRGREYPPLEGNGHKFLYFSLAHYKAAASPSCTIFLILLQILPATLIVIVGRKGKHYF